MDPVRTGWLPAEYLDEVVPSPLPRPEDWLRRQVDGWALASAETDEDEIEPVPTAPGEVVEFVRLRVWANFTVEITADGYATRGHVPPEATTFRGPFDNDTIAFSLDDFVDNWRANEAFIEQGSSETVDVEPYDWSDDIAFRLVVEGDAARLEPVDPEAFARLDAPAQPELPLGREA